MAGDINSQNLLVSLKAWSTEGFRNFRNAVFPYYKYNKPIRNIIFNFNKLVSDLDIDANTPDS